MKSKFKNILKYSVAYPYIFVRENYYNYLRKNNPPKYAKIRYKSYGWFLDLKNPKTIDDKVFFLEFNSNTALWTELSDKLKVRDYIINAGYEDILNEIYGVYNNSKEIDFESLPDSFVIKPNNASGAVIVVGDKNQLNIKKTNKQINKWLKMDYGKLTAQPHYSLISPKILIEKVLIDDFVKKGRSLADYKLFCINGEPVCIEMMMERNKHGHQRRFYDLQWKVRDEWMLEGYPIAPIVDKPESLDIMISIARKLAAPFAFVRVDFYEIDGKPIFGELTFTPGWGECSRLFQYHFGNIIDISNFIIKE